MGDAGASTFDPLLRRGANTSGNHPHLSLLISVFMWHVLKQAPAMERRMQCRDKCLSEG
ncbi:hypothetical protein TRIUR3_17435 [Triticum urartu]|uniref:Uncharacterized protein n=1 Tax=Triticum urartu TaxID=4572 RepID=M8A972_TRIUA|nr:hypothetical protein TRIUR3_17435 [Triticum urartu]